MEKSLQDPLPRTGTRRRKVRKVRKKINEDEPTAKDHRWMMRAEAGSKDIHLTHHSNAENQSGRIPRTKVSSPSSCVDIPYRITCSSLTNLTDSSPMRIRTSGCVALIMLEAAASSAETVRIVCEETIVFVLLVYWTWRKNIRKNIQMEKWDDTVLAIRATMDTLVCKCGQLPGMHALSDSATVSYPYSKGKMSALKVLMNNDVWSRK